MKSSFTEKLQPFLKIASQKTSPITMDARPMTIAPRPMLTSAVPWNCVISPPESATTPLESARPMTFIRSMLMPCARLIAGLEPVARSAEPCSVPKYQ